MPTDWITVSGVITNIATALDLGYRYTPHEKIAGKSAEDILKKVEKVLRSANVVLENHKDILPGETFKELKDTYRKYHWQMTDEAQENRAATDDLIKQSRILSQLYANRTTHQDRAKALLRRVEVYQTSVLTASRSASAPGFLAFEDEDFPASNPSEKQPSGLDSYTSWFSAFKGSTSCPTPPPDLEQGASQLESPSTSVVERKGFVVAVTHFPRSTDSTVDVATGEINKTVVGNGSTIYRRMISFENDEKRIEIIDPVLYALDKSQAYIAESSLRAMSELGESLLGQLDSGV
ncbi:hypothetical protein BDV93DRAFT_557494 [Ceratobasidium sp. AG-I]|nr:hypothetical protein BDV93DRAFT_557494 [Ceratobasidium sp. AG-I]